MPNVAKTYLYQYPGLLSPPCRFPTPTSPPTWRASLDLIPKRSVLYHCLAKVWHDLAHGKLRDATELARVSTTAVIHYHKAPAPDTEEDECKEAIC